MNPRITANQQRTFLHLFAQVTPLLGSDSGLPRRIKDLLGRNRAFGSRDRRLYRELIYTGIRFLPWIAPLLETEGELASQIIAWLAPNLRDTKDYRAALCVDWPAVPATLAEKAAVLTNQVVALRSAISPRTETPDPVFQPEALLPAWFREHCPAAFASPHLDTINERAPLWVRLQVNDSDHVLAEFSGKGWAPVRATELPDAICLPPNAEVADTDAYRRGFVEIQDLGSQLVLHHAPVASVRGIDRTSICVRLIQRRKLCLTALMESPVGRFLMQIFQVGTCITRSPTARARFEQNAFFWHFGSERGSALLVQ